MTAGWPSTWRPFWPPPEPNGPGLSTETTALTSCRPRRPSTVCEWRPGNGGAHSFVVDPAALGLAPARREDLKGGDPALNARAVKEVLSGSVRAPERHRVAQRGRGIGRGRRRQRPSGGPLGGRRVGGQWSGQRLPGWPRATFPFRGGPENLAGTRVLVRQGGREPTAGRRQPEYAGRVELPSWPR